MLLSVPFQHEKVSARVQIGLYCVPDCNRNLR